jgi:hypothetical protein
MKIMLLVPDGVAVRNYVYSDFVEELTQCGFEVVLYHQIPDAAIDEIKKVKGTIVSDIVKIPEFKENFFGRILKESIVYARLLQNKSKLKNDTILLFWNRNQKGFKRLTLLRISEFFGYFLSKSYALILKFEKVYDNTALHNSVSKVIEMDLLKIKPDYILNLHQRAVISAPIINVAKQLSIPTGTVIFSWDNIPKARLVSKYDHYFVWSNLMKNELHLLYPEINSNQVFVTGTPQFEFYFKEHFLQSKADFFQKFGLNLDKKTICFSANDTSSPYEQLYFEDLCEELMTITEADRPQILFRKCPVDKTNRFDAVLEKYKELVFSIEPDWRIQSGDTSFVYIYPSYDDFELLANTVLHSDVVINLGSTMAHDFAVFNKPCLYLNYDPVSNSIFKVKEVYQFQHFRSMKELNAVGWIDSKSDFIPKIQAALSNPDSVGSDRLQWMQRIVNYPLQESSANLAKEIKRCTSV